jgi:hypothetical protein
MGAGARAEDVVAGARDVVLRVPGVMIRGRLVDERGEPAARRVLVARMRDAPTHLVEPFLAPNARAETDADGRFWMTQLLPGVYDVELPGALRLVGGEAVQPSLDERELRIDPGSAISGLVVDEVGEPLAEAWIQLVPDRFGVRARTNDDGTFRIEGLDAARTHTVVAVFPGSAPYVPRSDAKEVRGDATDVRLQVDTRPRLRLSVDGRSRMGGGSVTVRLEEVGGGRQRTFHDRRIDWRAAPAGTWRVMAHVPEVDAEGRRVKVWLEVGTIRTGDPERTFVVPP